MKSLFIFIIVGAALFGMSVLAWGQERPPSCSPYAMVTKSLAKNFDERLVAVGRVGGTVSPVVGDAELWKSPDGATWSILFIPIRELAPGIKGACMMSAGVDMTIGGEP